MSFADFELIDSPSDSPTPDSEPEPLNDLILVDARNETNSYLKHFIDAKMSLSQRLNGVCCLDISNRTVNPSML